MLWLSYACLEFDVFLNLGAEYNNFWSNFPLILFHTGKLSLTVGLSVETITPLNVQKTTPQN